MAMTAAPKRRRREMIAWFKRLTCHHEWVPSRKLDGVTLGWDALPERSWTLWNECRLCGKKEDVQEGMLLPLFKAIHPELYEKEHPYWPINEKGERLEIAEYQD